MVSLTDADPLHDLAVSAGAMVLGEEGSTQHYLFTLEQLAWLLDMPAPAVPPCPIPPPPA